jgi:putative heme degradation protein
VVVAVVRDTAGINARLSVVLAPQTSKDKTVIRFVGSRHMIQCSPWFVVQLAASLVWVNIRCNNTVHKPQIQQQLLHVQRL